MEENKLLEEETNLGNLKLLYEMKTFQIYKTKVDLSHVYLYLFCFQMLEIQRCN